MQLAQQTVAVLRRKMLAKCSLYLQRRKRLVWRSFWRDCRIIGARWRRISPPPTEDGEAHAAVYGESHSGGFSVPHRLSLSKAFPFSFQGRNCRQFRNANKRKGSTAGSSLAYPALCVRRTAFAGFCGVKTVAGRCEAADLRKLLLENQRPVQYRWYASSCSERDAWQKWQRSATLW